MMTSIIQAIRQFRVTATFVSKYCIHIILCAHVSLLAYAAYCDAPTEMEIAHLPAGLSHWQTGSFYYFRQNPPLTRLVASLPVLSCPHAMPEMLFSENPYIRPELELGVSFLDANRPRAHLLYMLARWACIPFSLLGGWICFLWGRDLFGHRAGVISATLWCFSPMVIGHGHLITPDAPSAALGVCAAYAFWIWIRLVTWRSAAIAGFACGLALATKLTWIILLGLWPLLTLFFMGIKIKREGGFGITRVLCQQVCILAIAILTLDLVYGFEGVGRELGSYSFVSLPLSGNLMEDGETLRAGNRFRGTFLERIPVPFPRYFIEGIDVQKADFERPWRSYMQGDWKQGGWWYYYLYCIAVKTPVGVLLLCILSIGVALVPCFRADLFSEAILGSIIVAIVVLCSSQSSMGIHYRYMLPCFPFIFIWISRAGHSAARHCGILTLTVRTTVCVLLFIFVSSSLYVYPHSIAFFNVMAGGPQNGFRHLLGSNLDWGQDVLRLRDWIRSERPEVMNPKVAIGSYMEPSTVGLQCSVIEGRPPSSREFSATDITPGLYAISVNHLHGLNSMFAFFQMREPVHRIGYTINIYELSPSEAGKIKKQGLILSDALGSVGALEARILETKVAILVTNEWEESSSAGLCDYLNGVGGVHCMLLKVPDILDGRLSDFDVVIVPGGSATAKAELLGNKGLSAIREFIRSGKGYIGICGGAYLATKGYGLDIVGARVQRGVHRGEDGFPCDMLIRGTGDVKMEVTEIGHQVFNRMKEVGSMPYTGGPIFVTGEFDEAFSGLVLAKFGSEVVACPAQKNTMIGSPAVTLSKFEDGSVLLFSPHPDFMQQHLNLIIRAIEIVMPSRKI